MTTFTARYGGKCGGCGHRIVPGQEVVYVDDLLTHAEHEGDALQLAKPAATVCMKCFIEKPCGCDDGQGPL